MYKNILKEAVQHYRRLVAEEMEREKIINGKIIGPRKLCKKDHIELEDIIQSDRPFLSKKTGSDVDKAYVTTFRIGNMKKPESLYKTGYGTDVVGGIEFGSSLVKKGIINSLEDISEFLYQYKIGILDIYKEKETDKGMEIDLRVYECIDCAGLPNIGKPICYFETGLIIGLLSELTQKRVNAIETRCWTSGFSFCQFEVDIEK